MPGFIEWIGSNVYIKMSGGNLATPVEVQARFKKIKLAGKVKPVDVTAGPNRTTAKQRPGMEEYDLEITFNIDQGTIRPAHLEFGQTYTMLMGPDGSTAGKPAHEAEYFLSEMPLEVDTGINERVYQTKWALADTPTKNFFKGGVMP